MDESSERARRRDERERDVIAHLALIARRGPAWFRSAGTADAPGTTLITVSGTRVLEVPVGTRVGDVTEPGEAMLFGGYGGAWLPGEYAR